MLVIKDASAANQILKTTLVDGQHVPSHIVDASALPDGAATDATLQLIQQALLALPLPVGANAEATQQQVLAAVQATQAGVSALPTVNQTITLATGGGRQNVTFNLTFSSPGQAYYLIGPVVYTSRSITLNANSAGYTTATFVASSYVSAVSTYGTAGNQYAVGDIVSAVSVSTGTQIVAAQFQVTGVNGTAGITSAVCVNAGLYSGISSSTLTLGAGSVSGSTAAVITPTWTSDGAYSTPNFVAGNQITISNSTYSVSGSNPYNNTFTVLTTNASTGTCTFATPSAVTNTGSVGTGSLALSSSSSMPVGATSNPANAPLATQTVYVDSIDISVSITGTLTSAAAGGVYFTLQESSAAAVNPISIQTNLGTSIANELSGAILLYGYCALTTFAAVGSPATTQYGTAPYSRIFQNPLRVSTGKGVKLTSNQPCTVQVNLGYYII